MQYVDRERLVEKRISEKPLDLLQAYIGRLGLDGVIVPRFDPYQGEVVAAHDERLAYLTGFTGSAGIALILKDQAVLFVDGRYQVQVKSEVDLARFTIAHFFDNPIEAWIRERCSQGAKLGVNVNLIPGSLYDRLDAALKTLGGTLVPLDRDAVDAIWPDQLPPPMGPITAFPLLHTGESSADKRLRLAKALAATGADMLAETQPDNIAWLLNVRGSDIAHTPIAHSTMLLHASGQVDWFVDRGKLPNDLSGIEANGLQINDPDAFLATVEQLVRGKTISLDTGFTSVSVRLAVERGDGKPLIQTSPITLAKAIKNPVELDGMRRCHVEDGVAMTEFLAWLDTEVVPRYAAGDPVTELEAQAILLDFRRQGQDFAEESFTPISAAGSNAAMCHYSSKPETNAPLTPELPYLIDSGGQYFGGTTDVTRTAAFGPMPAHIVETYTAVVKGFVALASANFPRTATGHHLDALARRPLWDLGLDYDHGTGHGVGHFLSVHEHPHRFGKAVNAHAFQPGVVMTIEPGYYAEAQYGLRVENQVETIEGRNGFLAFRSLTLVPIDLSFVDMTKLSKAEIAWLDAYHATVAQALAGRLSARAQAYLARLTAPIVVQ